MKTFNNLKESRDYIINFLRKIENDESLHGICSDIGKNIQKHGDTSLKKYLKDFDNFNLEFELGEEFINDSFSKVSKKFIDSIQKSINRSRDFHKNSMPKSWNNSSGSLGENIIPVDKALCYVPGGTAPLVSTVVMTVVPAKTAGVREVIVTTPAINNVISNEIIVAAKMAGADRIFMLGGAHSIFAFAHGTQTVHKVDLICGPGK